MSIDLETIRILQQDAEFRSQFGPSQELRELHGLNQEEAERLVTLARQIDELSDEILMLKEQDPVNWKKEGF